MSDLFLILKSRPVFFYHVTFNNMEVAKKMMVIAFWASVALFSLSIILSVWEIVDIELSWRFTITFGTLVFASLVSLHVMNSFFKKQ